MVKRYLAYSRDSIHKTRLIITRFQMGRLISGFKSEGACNQGVQGASQGREKEILEFLLMCIFNINIFVLIAGKKGEEER